MSNPSLGLLGSGGAGVSPGHPGYNLIEPGFEYCRYRTGEQQFNVSTVATTLHTDCLAQTSPNHGVIKENDGLTITKTVSRADGKDDVKFEWKPCDKSEVSCDDLFTGDALSTFLNACTKGTDKGRVFNDGWTNYFIHNRPHLPKGYNCGQLLVNVTYDSTLFGE